MRNWSVNTSPHYNFQCVLITQLVRLFCCICLCLVDFTVTMHIFTPVSHKTSQWMFIWSGSFELMVRPFGLGWHRCAGRRNPSSAFPPCGFTSRLPEAGFEALWLTVHTFLRLSLSNSVSGIRAQGPKVQETVRCGSDPPRL